MKLEIKDEEIEDHLNENYNLDPKEVEMLKGMLEEYIKQNGTLNLDILCLENKHKFHIKELEL